MSERTPYYDLRIGMLDTDTVPKRSTYGAVVPHVCVRDNDANLGLSVHDLDNYESEAESVVVADVLDNGEFGDGLTLRFRHNGRDVDVDETALLFSIDFTPAQARVLAAALKTAADLRAAAKEGGA